jgi:polysaccharide biosynthesis protein PslJ
VSVAVLPGGRRGTLPRPAVAVLGSVALLAVTVVAGSGAMKIAAGLVIAVAALGLTYKRLFTWPSMLTAVVLCMFIIPMDRYNIVGHLPIQMEPYRVLVLMIMLAWFSTMLIDSRVRMSKTGFEGPVTLICIATLGSLVVNPGRVAFAQSTVIKGLWFFLTFIFVLYFMTSIIKTRAHLDRVLKLIVGLGAFIAIEAVIERRMQFNLFDHLHGIIPGIVYTPIGEQVRNGEIRATASSGNPIELAAVLAILLPLAIYVAASSGKKRWMYAAFAIAVGDFSSGSRTGMVGLIVIIVSYLVMRRREVMSKVGPAILPGLVVLHFAVPGAIGSIKNAFFPQGGLIAQQSAQVKGIDPRLSHNRLNVWGPGLTEYSEHNPLFGEGYSTRVTGHLSKRPINAAILDNQWLKSLLETGMLGVAAWMWWFFVAVKRLGRLAKIQRGTPEGWLPVGLAASIAAYAVTMFTYDAFSFIQGAWVNFTILAIAAITLRLGTKDRIT